MNEPTVQSMSQSDALRRFLEAERLPPSMLETIASVYRPLAHHIAQHSANSRPPFVAGLCGPQGSGKSTLAALLRILLEDNGASVATISLDDFYLTRAERERLAARVHPLLQTRGVPGTHDVALAVRTLEALSRSGDVALPSFDKANDDRRPEDHWPRVRAPIDIVILEGWCVGATAQPEAALGEPINALEQDCDREGTWRRYVNACLDGEYRALFARLDASILLTTRAFDVVFEWRAEQERKLREQREREGGDTSRLMSEAQLRRFVAHYERLTCHIMAEMPNRADVTLHLDATRRIERVSERR